MNAISKISPWTAKPLSDAAKNAKFRAVMDLAAERVILGRSAIVTGWAIGGVGVACFAASIFGWVTLLPLKTSEVKFFLVDKSTGIIAEPVGLQDAPKMFGAAVEQQYLKRYIEAREGWVPEMDERNDHLTKLMSTPDEQARYAAARNAPLSPVKALGKDGHVSVENFRFHPLAIGKDGETRRYLVQFDRTVWRGANQDPTQAWSATVDFQWHPELPMRPDDRTRQSRRVSGAGIQRQFRHPGPEEAVMRIAAAILLASVSLAAIGQAGGGPGHHASRGADPGRAVLAAAAHRDRRRHRATDHDHVPAGRERLSRGANRQARQGWRIGGCGLARGVAIGDQGHAARQQPDPVAGRCPGKAR